MFLGKEELASQFSEQTFLMTLAYLTGIFAKLNEINLHMLGKDKHLAQLVDLINLITKNLELAGTPCFMKHISALRGHFTKYLRSNYSHYDWVRDPFSAVAPAELSASLRRSSSLT